MPHTHEPEWLLTRIYQGWIEEHIPKDEIVGNCTIWARVMREAFPELTHVGGYVRRQKSDDPFWACVLNEGRRVHYHEYLRAPDGTVVDPTWRQFGDGFEYLECEEHLII